MLMALPIPALAVLGASVVDSRLADRAERDLTRHAELETSRLRDHLVGVESAAQSVVFEPQLRDLMDTPQPDNAALRAALADVAPRSGPFGATFHSILLVDRQGNPLTAYGDPPNIADLPQAAMAMETRSPIFGPAISADGNEGSLLLAAPVTAADGAVLGAAWFEARLRPLVDPLLEHERTGESIEAILVQRSADGGAQLLTFRRFDRASAFTILAATDPALPSVLSLAANEPTTVWAEDYRETETVSALQRIEPVGWGLTIKMDRSEAMAFGTTINRAVGIGSALALLVLFIGWLAVLRPLGHRLTQTALAAEAIAGGQYGMTIDDHRGDEIGDLARTIDRLATDLAEDIAAREAAEAQLRFAAEHDELTGLISRSRASRSLHELHDSGHRYGVFFVDLNGFKEVNDEHGHPIGDQVLATYSRRLRETLPENSLVARWGGDEFLVIHPSGDSAELESIAVRIEAACDEAIMHGEIAIALSSSVGMATSQPDLSVDDIIRRADEAMLQRKDPLRPRVVPIATRQMVETALAENRVAVHWQPLVSFESAKARVVGAEALVRLIDNNGQLVQPGEFLPQIAATPLGEELDQRVFAMTIRTLGELTARKSLPDEFTVSVNIGPRLLANGDGLAATLEALHAHRVDAQRLMVEIPETAQHVAPESLAALRRAGVLIAVDDVGRKFSNLERMYDLSADMAKIDRRWISRLSLTSDRLTVVRALVQQCRVLGMRVLAEGVETSEEVRALRTLGVTLFQGFHFGYPMDAADFAQRHLRDTTSSTSKLGFRPAPIA